MNISEHGLCLKEGSNSDGHQFYKYQQNEQSPLILTELTSTKKNPRQMTMEIQILAWDRHKNAAGLNRLMGFNGVQTAMR